jgi:SARP family transcriptional regulator, regulator of embCAB operon
MSARPIVNMPRNPVLLNLGVLGPVQVRVDNKEVAIQQLKLRMLLASLAMRENAVVSVDSLIRELWNDEAPATALQALRVYVSQLRRFFAVQGIGEDVCRVVTQAPGYRLIVADNILDSQRFFRLCDEARVTAADFPEKASKLYREALALYRGRALADVRVQSLVLDSFAAWLDESWLSANIQSIDLKFRLGRHHETVGELRRLAAEHPMNELLHSRLMVALHVTGRSNDAMSVYRSIRALMRDELGTEPGRELRHVLQVVLA